MFQDQATQEDGNVGGPNNINVVASIPGGHSSGGHGGPFDEHLFGDFGNGVSLSEDNLGRSVSRDGDNRGDLNSVSLN